MNFPTEDEFQSILSTLNHAASTYTPSAGPNGHMSRAQVIEKARKLIQALTSPDELPIYHCLNMAELLAIRTFIKLKVLEAIPTTGSISLKKWAKDTGVQESLLERMSRVLVTTGFLDQTRPDGGDYRHTKFSQSYTIYPGPGQLFISMYDNWFKNMYNFDDYLTFRSEARGPDNKLYNLYTWTHKQGGTALYEIMAQGPEQLHAFQASMTGMDVVVPVVGHFDFSLLKTTTTTEEEGYGDGNKKGRIELVDVGGGRGACLKQILEAYPELDARRCVLQDVGENIRAAKEDKELPEGLQFMEHDFHKEQPVKGAKAYLLRLILHNYSDTICIEILSHLASAMASDSRLLICDVVLPERIRTSDLPVAALDQIVMVTGGRERKEEDFRKLLDAAGLELVRIWKGQGVAGGYVEGKVKSSEEGYSYWT